MPQDPEVSEDSASDVEEVDFYVSECAKRKIVPISHYLKNANASELSLRYRNVDGALFDAIRTNSSIRRLDLSRNRIGHDQRDLPPLREMIAQNQKITDLDMSFNCLNVTGCEVLADALEKNDPLRVLSVSSNCIGDRGTTLLSKAIINSGRLRKLDLAHNDISGARSSCFSVWSPSLRMSPP